MDAKSVSAFIRLGRVKFLPYSAVLYAYGASLYLTQRDTHQPAMFTNQTSDTWEESPRLQSLDMSTYLAGQAMITLFHLMTHYCNEYFDYAADCANQAPTSMTGGSRVLVQGLLSPTTCLKTCLILLITSVVLVATLAESWQAKAIGFIIIALAWFYTAPPIRFNYRGMGELCVAAVLNLGTPLFAYTLQMDAAAAVALRSQQATTLHLLAMLLPGAILQVCRMALMNLMDYDGDMASNKRTLPTLVCRDNVKHFYAAGHVVSYASVLALALCGFLSPVVALAFWTTLPLSVWNGRRLYGLQPEKRASRDAFPKRRTSSAAFPASSDPFPASSDAFPESNDELVARNGSIAFWASTHVALVPVAMIYGLLFSEIVGSSLFATLFPSIAMVLFAPTLLMALVAMSIRASINHKAQYRGADKGNSVHQH